MLPSFDLADPEGLVIDGLSSAAFPGTSHAQALIHVPTRFDPTAPAAVLYFHGFDNCIYNALQPRATQCPHGQEPQASAELVAQLARSGRSAALIVPEVLAHVRSSEPGALANPGALSALLDEVCARCSALRGLRAADFQRVIIISHSGAYRVAAALVSTGGLTVHELYLLDSLYGEEAAFEEYAAQDPGVRRLVLLYGDGTAPRSRALWGRLRARLLALGVAPSRLRFHDQPGAPDAADLDAAVLCRRVVADHSDIPRSYLANLLRSSGLPP